MFIQLWHVNMISGIAELGNSDCNKSNTEPDSHDVGYIEDKHTHFREIQNLRLKNLEKIIVGQLNINSLRNILNLLRPLVQNREDILIILWLSFSYFLRQNLIILFRWHILKSLGTLLLTEMVMKFYSV